MYSLLVKDQEAWHAWCPWDRKDSDNNDWVTEQQLLSQTVSITVPWLLTGRNSSQSSLKCSSWVIILKFGLKKNFHFFPRSTHYFLTDSHYKMSAVFPVLYVLAGSCTVAPGSWLPFWDGHRGVCVCVLSLYACVRCRCAVLPNPTCKSTVFKWLQGNRAAL